MCPYFSRWKDIRCFWTKLVWETLKWPAQELPWKRNTLKGFNSVSIRTTNRNAEVKKASRRVIKQHFCTTYNNNLTFIRGDRQKKKKIKHSVLKIVVDGAASLTVLLVLGVSNFSEGRPKKSSSKLTSKICYCSCFLQCGNNEDGGSWKYVLRIIKRLLWKCLLLHYV